MTNTLDIIALEAAETSRVFFSTLAELASAICEKHLGTWSQRMLQEAGIHLEVTGREHIPAHEDYIVVSNRQSRYDIPVLYQALGMPMQMLESKEVARIPIRAMSTGKRILPVTIKRTRRSSGNDYQNAPSGHKAKVTISAPIDPASYGSDKIEALITDVKGVIESNFSGNADAAAASAK